MSSSYTDKELYAKYIQVRTEDLEEIRSVVTAILYERDAMYADYDEEVLDGNFD